jgi:hypothetical protein
MKSFFMALLLLITSTAYSQLIGEWQGYAAEQEGHGDAFLHLTDSLIWYYNLHDLGGGQVFNTYTGQQQLSSNFFMLDVSEDQRGNVWGVGPDNTIYNYQAGTWQSFPVPDSVRNAVPPVGANFHRFASVAFDNNNTMWIAALYYVWRYDGQTWTKFDMSTTSSVDDIKVDKNDVVWGRNLSNFTDITCYKNGACTSYNSNDHGLLNGHKLSYVYIDDNNRKWWGISCDAPTWVCPDSNLFLMYNDTTWTIYTSSQVGLGVEDIEQVVGTGNTLWAVSTDPQRLIYYDGTTWTAYDPKDYSISNLFTSTNNRNTFVVDDNNTIWGYNYLKLFSFDGTTSTTYKLGVGGNAIAGGQHIKAVGGSKLLWMNGEVGYINLDNHKISLIEELASENDTSDYYMTNGNYYSHVSYKANNDIWIANSGLARRLSLITVEDTLSLFHYDGTNWTETKIDTQVAPHVTSVTDMAVHNNEVWLTTATGVSSTRIIPTQGLLKWDGTAWTGNYPAPLDGELSNIAVTSTGKLWISSDNQLIEYQSGTITTYDYTNANIPNAKITDLHYNNNTNTLWATTDSAGLLKHDGTTWTTYNTQNSGIATDLLLTLTATTTGEIWIGTRDSGLVHFDGNSTWKTINTNTPNNLMVSNTVTSLEVDSNSNVWFFNEKFLLVYQEGGLVNIKQLPDEPTEWSSKNYPNPFTHSTTIEYNLEHAAKVELQIFNLQGQVIATQTQEQDKGLQQVEWQPTSALPTGVYFYRVLVGRQPIARGQLIYKKGS